MDSLNTWCNVTERDIDLLLVEELHVSQSFASWFVSKALEQNIVPTILGCWHSVTDGALGESDIIFKFVDESGVSQALLIENKVDAYPQPSQGKRYQLRGEKGKQDGLWSSFKTCLMAPNAYLDRSSEIYASYISYESIVQYFQEAGDERSKYRASVLMSAIEKQRRGYVSSVSDAMTEYAKDYLSYVAKNYPELKPEQAKPRAEGHTWIHFHPFRDHQGIKIIHQIYGDVVKVMFSAQADRYDELKLIFNEFASYPISVKQSGKSVVAEVKVPPIDPIKETFDSSLFAAEQAIAVALELFNYMESVRHKLITR